MVNLQDVSESGLFSKCSQLLISEPEVRQTWATIPVAYDTPVERLGKLITKDNGAILSRDEGGDLHIITKYDIIQSLTRQ